MTEETPTTDETLISVQRLSRDLAIAAATLSDLEARFLVDAYYAMQNNRKRTSNQTLAMKNEPHNVLSWLFQQDEILENQIKRALDKYTDNKEIGRWMKSIYGIGPVISAGLIAHIDIKRCNTVSPIWKFAGLDPTMKWEKGKKRPWNAELKTLCWKIGQSFMKFSNHDDCFYGHIYRRRKDYELSRNESGANAALAAALLPKFSKTTDAYKHLLANKLPPGQIDARARRYAVKMFLAHLHMIWFWFENDAPPPKPYIIAIGGHADMIYPPNMPDGLRQALSTVRP
jgi:hypothetical protein